jgi:hypothetical protein
MPTSMPNTGGGFTAREGLGVLNGAALLCFILVVTCASSGLAYARYHSRSSR